MEKEMILPELEKLFKSNFSISIDDYYKFSLESVCDTPYDGFIPFTDGGFYVTKEVSLCAIFSSGMSFKIPELDKVIDTRIENCFEYAKEAFKERHPEYKDIDVDYHYLSDIDCNLAEEYSEIETEFLMEDTIQLGFYVYYYTAENTHSGIKGKDCFYVFAVANWECPYFRHGKNNEYTFFEKDYIANKGAFKKIEKLMKKFNKAIPDFD